MKNLRLLSLVAAVTLSSVPAFAADATGISIDQALKIAQNYLQKSGKAADVQIIGLVYEKSSFKEGYWWAKWSHAVAVDGDRKETGLRIDPDGTVTRFVSAPGGTFEPPAGQRPIGARSMR